MQAGTNVNSQGKIGQSKTRNFDLYEDAGSSDSDTSRALEAYNARMNELLGGDGVNDDLQQKSLAE